MKDRIQKIIDEENLTPSRFADEVGLNRPAVSHILNGRNNPGLEALQRIINRFPNINATWLITGKGNMYNSDSKDTTRTPSLFDDAPSPPENPIFQPEIQPKHEYSREIAVKTSQNVMNIDENQSNNVLKTPSARVKKIAIFYTDNTYEEFIPAEKS
jgi:transcriptional regulator with XRE-family HTH domain